jgi:hypothetical protein
VPTTTFQVAGIVFRVESDLHLSHLHSNTFEEFGENGAEPDVTCRIRSTEGRLVNCGDLSEEEKEFLEGCVRYPLTGLDNPLLCLPPIRARLDPRGRQSESISLEIRDSSVVVFDFANKELEAFYHPDHAHILERSRIGPGFFAPFLPIFSATMVHSSALVSRGQTALFLAPDGGGKTTLIQRAFGGTILGDDQIVLREEHGLVVAHGTPWNLFANSRVCGRVAGMFLLEQAERFELTPIESVNALEYLWNEHALSRLFLPRHSRLRVFEILHRACNQASVHMLRFSPNDIDWQAIHAAVVSQVVP